MKNLVKALRIKRRMSQSELAYCCGVSRQTIYSIEKEIFSPSLELAYKLSKVLNFKMEDMYDFSEFDLKRMSFFMNYILHLFFNTVYNWSRSY